MKIQGNGVQKKNKILVKRFLRILKFNSASPVIFGVTLNFKASDDREQLPFSNESFVYLHEMSKTQSMC